MSPHRMTPIRAIRTATLAPDLILDVHGQADVYEKIMEGDVDILTLTRMMKVMKEGPQ